MIRCKKCKKFAKPHSLETWWLTGAVKSFKVKCKKHGIVDGEYDDYTYDLINSFTEKKYPAKAKFIKGK